jgi:exodeoxyribonuclease VII large subunit
MEQPSLVEEPTLTVADLCAGVGRVLARAFPEAVWVRGEIANKHASPHGHVFFDLVDASGGASIRVVLWRDDRRVVNAVLRRSGHAVRIDDGTEVRVRAMVGWHPGSGLVRLRMLSIDTAYTLGRLAEDRERLVRMLERDGVLGRQAALPLARVPLRVGLVTSAGSSAAADFVHILEASGWAWRVALCDTRVQGPDAEPALAAALSAVASSCDVVCVIRGGGARTDLAAFDREAVARAIAGCPVPVLTGIGHETDTTVADLVAHRSFTTPTACAAFLVDRVGTFLGAADEAWRSIRRRAAAVVDRSDERIQRAAGRVEGAWRRHLRGGEIGLERAERRLALRTPRLLDAEERRLDAIAARLPGLDPARLLARGWTLTRTADGRLVRGANELVTGDEIVTTFVDGRVASRVGSIGVDTAG